MQRTELSAKDFLAREEWFDKGLDYLWINEYDEAIEAFSEVIKLDPGFAIAYRERGYSRILKMIRDKTLKHPDLTSEVVEDFDEAIRFDPTDADAYWMRGVVRHDELMDQDIKLAPHERRVVGIRFLTKAIELNPQHVCAYITRGYMYHRDKQKEAAIADCLSACLIDPQPGKYGKYSFIMNKTLLDDVLKGTPLLDLYNAIRRHPEGVELAKQALARVGTSLGKYFDKEWRKELEKLSTGELSLYNIEPPEMLCRPKKAAGADAGPSGDARMPVRQKFTFRPFWLFNPDRVNKREPSTDDRYQRLDVVDDERVKKPLPHALKEAGSEMEGMKKPGVR